MKGKKISMVVKTLEDAGCSQKVEKR